MGAAVYVTGDWIPDVPDKRDLYLAVPPIRLKAPRSKVLAMRMPPIYNQRNLGSCTAQACRRVIQFTEKQHFKFTKKRPVPSALFIYQNTLRILGWFGQDKGATLRDTWKAVARWGYLAERHWPYNLDFKTMPPELAYKRAEAHRLTESRYMRVRQTLPAMKQALLDEHPFAFGAALYESFDRAQVDGIVRLPNVKAEDMVGGHAMVVIGYDDDREAFLVDNSWGRGWGLEGRCWFPYDYILDPDMCADFWTYTSVATPEEIK